MNVVDLLISKDIFATRSEIRRAILQKSVKINNILILDFDTDIEDKVFRIERGKKIYNFG